MSTADFGGRPSFPTPSPDVPSTRVYAPPQVPVQPIPTSALPATAVPASGLPYSVPAYGYPPPVYPFAPAPTAAPRRPAWLWPVAVLAVLVLGAMAFGGGYAIGLTGSSQTGLTGAWKAGTPGAASYERPPATTAAQADWNAWASRAATAELTAQAKALLAGNQDGFLAPVDPSNTALVTTLKNRFANLHAMGPGVWSQKVGTLRASGSRAWTASVTIDYCFGEATCARAEFHESSRWAVADDRLVLSKMDAATADDLGPRPWENDQLTVQAGKRVVVSSTKVNAWRVPGAVTIADQAAAISDTFARWEPAPSRYVIFFAGPDDWRRWYGMDEPEWAAAWSIPVAESVTEIVVRSEVVSQSDLAILLTHEMTHVTTLAGPRLGATDSAWWLIEGIAEYASHLNVPLRNYDGEADTVDFVRHSWDGNPAVEPPGQNATQTEAGGKYGVAWLSVLRMADKYGKDKMLTFWGHVVHDDDTFDEAARAAYGVPWSTVRADCANFVRAQVAPL